MLPVITLDFAALCGLNSGDFFGPERIGIRAQTYAFADDKLPTMGTLDAYFSRLVAGGLARRTVKTPVLICYAATPSFVALHVCSRRRARLSYLQRSTALETGMVPLSPQAMPYLWWNGAHLTRLHPLPAGESPAHPRVEDFGNPFGLVSEQVPRKQWKQLRVDIWNTDYAPVPMEETQTLERFDFVESPLW